MFKIGDRVILSKELMLENEWPMGVSSIMKSFNNKQFVVKELCKNHDKHGNDVLYFHDYGWSWDLRWFRADDNIYLTQILNNIGK